MEILSLGFWFDTRPGALGQPYFSIFVIILAVLLAAAFITSIMKKRQKGLYFKIWRNIESFSAANFIIGLFLLFFVYEMIYFLSMRFWLLLWIISMGVWKVFILKSFLKIPEEKERLKKEREFKKYVP